MLESEELLKIKPGKGGAISHVGLL
jgi:hypothetical protein